MANPDVRKEGISPEVFTDDATTEVVEVKDASAVVGLLREALELRQIGVMSPAHQRKVDLALESALAYLASDEELRDYSNPDRRDEELRIENERENAATDKDGTYAMGLQGTVKAQPTSTRSNEPKK